MKTINVPAMAFDENLVFRPAKIEDVSAVVRLLNLCSVDQVGINEFAENEVLMEWSEPGFNLESDTRVVFNKAGEAVGYVEVWDTAPHTRLYALGKVHPDYRGTGLGTRLVWWSETRARQSLPKAPKGAQVSVFHWSYGSDLEAKELFLTRGFSISRHFLRMEVHMNGSPPIPAWPSRLDGSGPIAVRALAPGEAVDVLDAVIDAFRDHWGFVEKPYEEERERWLHWIESDKNHDPALWFLARDGDEIAGMSLCFRHAAGQPDMGWVETLGVRRPWRRRGLGLALLRHSFREYYRRGIHKVALGVDAQSLTGATRLYKKAGMHVAHTSNTYEKILRPGQELSTQSVK